MNLMPLFGCFSMVARLESNLRIDINLEIELDPSRWEKLVTYMGRLGRLVQLVVLLGD